MKTAIKLKKNRISHQFGIVYLFGQLLQESKGEFVHAPGPHLKNVEPPDVQVSRHTRCLHTSLQRFLHVLLVRGRGDDIIYTWVSPHQRRQDAADDDFCLFVLLQSDCSNSRKMKEILKMERSRSYPHLVYEQVPAPGLQLRSSSALWKQRQSARKVSHTQ